MPRSRATRPPGTSLTSPCRMHRLHRSCPNRRLRRPAKPTPCPVLKRTPCPVPKPTPSPVPSRRPWSSSKKSSSPKRTASTPRSSSSRKSASTTLPPIRSPKISSLRRRAVRPAPPAAPGTTRPQRPAQPARSAQPVVGRTGGARPGHRSGNHRTTGHRGDRASRGRLNRLRGRLARSQNVFGQSLLGLLGAGTLDEDSWTDVEDTQQYVLCTSSSRLGLWSC